ncbi:hypothetical protein DFH29DRAFT_876926 [Suillus ampliporus]|nr:hypothetical protein DFH29DRAFT_876926 [Suillus ampliporus]
MKGILSFILVTIAFLQMTAAAPTVSEHSPDIDKHKQNLVAEVSPETEDDIDVEKRVSAYWDLLVLFSRILLTRSVEYAALDDAEDGIKNHLYATIFGGECGDRKCRRGRSRKVAELVRRNLWMLSLVRDEFQGISGPSGKDVNGTCKNARLRKKLGFHTAASRAVPL